MNNEEFVTIGKIGSTYGVKGWFKVTSFTETIANILDYAPWYIEENQTWKSIEIDGAQEYGKGIIAKISGINNPEQARLLTGKKIAIKRAQLAKLNKNEYYWSDLEGLSVYNQHGDLLGKVAYLIATGSNDVLVIKGEKEIAIPYLPGDVIKNIDLDKKEMRVEWDLI